MSEKRNRQSPADGSSRGEARHESHVFRGSTNSRNQHRRDRDSGQSPGHRSNSGSQVFRDQRPYRSDDRYLSKPQRKYEEDIHVRNPPKEGQYDDYRPRRSSSHYSASIDYNTAPPLRRHRSEYSNEHDDDYYYQRSVSSSEVLIPQNLVRPVPLKPIFFSPKCMDFKNEGNTLVEVSGNQYIDRRDIASLDEFGKITRLARLSYSSMFVDFETHTMAQHAVATARLSHYNDLSYELADQKKIEAKILDRKQAEDSACDPPMCLVLHNFGNHLKLQTLLTPFNLTSFNYFPDRQLLFTYHNNKASVYDFILAFGPKKLSGLKHVYVTHEVNLLKLQEKVHKIIISKLIEECMNDCSDLLIPEVYLPALKRERLRQRYTPTKPININSFGLNFYISPFKVNFYLSPKRKVMTLKKKVKDAARERKTNLIKENSRQYQKKIEQEIQMKEESIQFEKLEQPPIENSSSRLTPIHHIDEETKRHYLRACALARRQPYVVARDSGLTLCQSQFPKAVEQQRRRNKNDSMKVPSNRGGGQIIVGKRIYFEKSAIQGWGLFALEHISADSFICEYTGDLVRSRVADKREKVYEKQGLPHMYLFRIDKEYVVDATVKGGKARFLNHSCNPNCRSKIIQISGHQTISFYAKKNIKPHDEITFDYEMEFEEDKTKWEKCFCGSKNCMRYLNYCEDPVVRKQRELATINDNDSD